MSGETTENVTLVTRQSVTVNLMTVAVAIGTGTSLQVLPMRTMRRISDSVRLLRCGDKSGTGTLPNPDPVTTAECGAGKYHDPSNDARFVFSELASEYNCTV